MIYLVVALAAEARPLISHLQLEKLDEMEPLTVYRRTDLALIVGGVGQESMASAVPALAQAISADDMAIWLNIGVVGHRTHEIGTVVLARKVVEGDTGTAYSLIPPDDVHMHIGEIRTVTHVETRYDSDAVYDMEAAAFCQGTAGLTSAELVQVLKVVSDNRRTGTLCVSARQVQGLIEDSLPKIDLLLSSLHRQARQLSQ